VPDQQLVYAVARDVTDRKRSETEQAAVRRVATLVARAGAPAQVFEAVTREIGLLCDADAARMCRFDPADALTPVATWSRDGKNGPALATCVERDVASIAAQVHETGRATRVDRDAVWAVGCPIAFAGRTWGVIVVFSGRETGFPPALESSIADFTELVATAISNADARTELVGSRARVVAAADEARRRLARDLHDGAQQRLIHSMLMLGLARRAIHRRDEEAEALVEQAAEYAQLANEALRELAHGILPADLTTGGLRSAIRAVVERLDLPVTVEVLEDRLPPEIEANAYFIVAEALTNVIKHACASSAGVSAQARGGALCLEVRDDGIGGARPDGRGLLGLRDRVAALGGELRVESPRGGGTRIAATLPLGSQARPSSRSTAAA
jgi:signal transduction histidine kinase